MTDNIVIDINFLSQGFGIIYGSLVLIVLSIVFFLIEYFLRKKGRMKYSIKSLKIPFLFGFGGSIYTSWFLNFFVKSTNYKLPLRSDLWPIIIFQVGLGFFFYNLSKYFFEQTNLSKKIFRAKTKEDTKELNELFYRVFSFVIVLISLLSIFITFGIKISSLSNIFGGVAIGLSLATQKFLQNIIGGLVLITSRPFNINDLIVTSNITGKVEDIGLFYTKIRTLENIPVYVPNSEMSNKMVHQLTQRTERRINADVTLRYEDLDKVGRIISSIKKDLYSHPGVDKNKDIFVKFHKWEESSINILVKCYTITKNYGEFLNIQEDIFLKISKSVKEEGGDFAFNSITIYPSGEENNNGFKTFIKGNLNK